MGEFPKQNISVVESNGQSVSQLDESTSSSCYFEVDNVSNYCLIIAVQEVVSPMFAHSSVFVIGRVVVGKY